MIFVIFSGSRPSAPDVGQDPLQRVSRGHTAVDQRQLVAAVDEVDVAVGIVGEPEGVCHTPATTIDLVRDSHLLTCLLARIEAR